MLQSLTNIGLAVEIEYNFFKLYEIEVQQG